MARIAFVLASDFEDSEFRIPFDGLRSVGHQLDVLGVTAGDTVSGKAGKVEVTIDKAVGDADARSYDALVIPGGYSPDRLRTVPAVVAFVAQMVHDGKLIAAICHGPQLLIEADAVRGKTVTSWPSVRTDLVNAGARWVDREVAIDGRLITSRTPDDLLAFTRAIEAHLAVREVQDRGGAGQPRPRHGH